MLCQSGDPMLGTILAIADSMLCLDAPTLVGALKDLLLVFVDPSTKLNSNYAGSKRIEQSRLRDSRTQLGQRLRFERYEIQDASLQECLSVNMN